MNELFWLLAARAALLTCLFIWTESNAGAQNLGQHNDQIPIQKQRLGEDDSMWVQRAQALSNASTASIESARFRARWYKNRIEDFSCDFSASHNGRNYEPGIGFLLRNNFSNLNSELAYG